MLPLTAQNPDHTVKERKKPRGEASQQDQSGPHCLALAASLALGQAEEAARPVGGEKSTGCRFLAVRPEQVTTSLSSSPISSSVKWG